MRSESPYARVIPLSYRYQPIQDDGHIRLLCLAPGQLGAPLSGRLEVVKLDSVTSYEAISYVWADPGPPDCDWEIRLHDGEVEGLLKLKTGSAYAALRRLRHPNKERRVWIDQICINQDNLEERSKQVKFMNSIFKNSDHVLVWLGLDENNEARPAFALIRKLYGIIRRADDDVEPKSRLVGDLQRELEENHKSLHALTKCRWFTRGWVVQEIGTRAPATLFWGDAHIGWNMLCIVCERLTDYHHLRSKLDINTSQIKFFFQRFIEPDKSSYHANRLNFLYELHRARNLSFTDDRDRVFAFLGHYSLQPAHCPNRELASIAANYEMTVEQLYRDVARRALQSQGDSALIALAAVQHTYESLMSRQEARNWTSRRETGTGTSENYKLPSWVPDWRIYRGFILSEPISPHRAHDGSAPDLEISEDIAVLQIHGLEVDSVEVCSRPLADKEFHQIQKHNGLEETVEYLWREVCKKGRFGLDDQYVNGETAFFAFTQTLSNGCVQAARREGRSYLEIDDSVWLEQAALYLVKPLGRSDAVSPELRSIGEKANLNGTHEKWSRLANGASKNRAFGRTRKGYYVLGPAVMEKGDVVCVFFGGKMPFCLRPVGERTYLLVGECYVHGLMKGEAIDKMANGQITESVFEIV